MVDLDSDLVSALAFDQEKHAICQSEVQIDQSLSAKIGFFYIT